jgi:hypothetical protein
MAEKGAYPSLVVSQGLSETEDVFTGNFASNILTNHLSIYLSYSKDKEVLNRVSNVAKVSETAVTESTSEKNLVSIDY